MVHLIRTEGYKEYQVFLSSMNEGSSIIEVVTYDALEPRKDSLPLWLDTNNVEIQNSDQVESKFHSFMDNEGAEKITTLGGFRN